MGLQRHEIHHFRNLHQVIVEPGASLNLITGSNASGKTSFLESIFYLSYGRSFRSGHFKELIEYNQEYFQLISRITFDDKVNQLGIEKSSSHQLIKLNQQPVTRLTDLSSLFPVVAIHPDSHQLISAGPDQRRQFIDWGVFHVEHSFMEHWKRYKTVLSQRNAALRQQQSDRLCQLWDKTLLESAHIIHRLRINYTEKLYAQISAYATSLFPNVSIDIQYRQGWNQDHELSDILQRNLSKDKEKGFTQHGPHRADLKISVDGKSAQSSISRGQQKKLVALLKLAQMQLYLQDTEKPCTLIYDDLPAELDRDNQTILMDLLSSMNIQAFISAIDIQELAVDSWSDIEMFHVEQGKISV